MEKKLRFLGLDVHAETIAVAVAEADGEVRSLGVIPAQAPAQAPWSALFRTIETIRRRPLAKRRR